MRAGWQGGAATCVRGVMMEGGFGSTVVRWGEDGDKHAGDRGKQGLTRGDEASMTCYGIPTKGEVAKLEGDGWGGDGGTSQTRRYHESQRVQV